MLPENFSGIFISLWDSLKYKLNVKNIKIIIATIKYFLFPRQSNTHIITGNNTADLLNVFTRIINVIKHSRINIE